MVNVAKPSSLADLTKDPNQPERDRWDRPLILQEDGTRKAYARVSKLAGTMFYEGSLADWKARNALVGGAMFSDSKRQDVLAAHESRNTKELNKLTWQAQELAGANFGAEYGNAVHSLTEFWDARDESSFSRMWSEVSEDVRQSVLAYVEATKDLKQVAIEQFVVNDEIQAAGSLDRLTILPEGFIAPDGTDLSGRCLVTDIKTTANLSYDPGKIAAQLAIYARSEAYNCATDTRTPLYDGTVCTTWGIVYHVPREKAECSLHWFNLTLGWESAKMSASLTELRKQYARKGVMSCPKV